MKMQRGFFVPARDQKSVISETGEGVQAKGKEQMKGRKIRVTSPVSSVKRNYILPMGRSRNRKKFPLEENPPGRKPVCKNYRTEISGKGLRRRNLGRRLNRKGACLTQVTARDRLGGPFLCP